MTAVATPTYSRRREAGLSFVIGLNLYLAGIYTNFAVKVGGFWVPGVLVIAGAIFMVRHTRNLFWLGWLMFFLTVSLVAGGSGAEMFGYRLTSWLQIIVALGCAHIMLCALDYPETVRKTLFLWMMFIIVGVILETTFSPIRDFSDAFRHLAFDGRFIYDDEVRDLQDYGFVRPKLFTQEPSHISKAFVVRRGRMVSPVVAPAPYRSPDMLDTRHIIPAQPVRATGASARMVPRSHGIRASRLQHRRGGTSGAWDLRDRAYEGVLDQAYAYSQRE